MRRAVEVGGNANEERTALARTRRHGLDARTSCSQTPGMAPRVSLTKAQLATEAGTSLLHLLTGFTSDGELSLGEIDNLKSWLTANKDATSLPAAAWLAELVETILQDGRVTPDERLELLLGIEKVLPKNERLLAQDRRKDAEAAVVAKEPVNRAIPVRDRATERQLAYLRILGIDITPDLTKDAASSLIDEFKDRYGDTTRRQLMVCRFWNRMDVAEGGKASVSSWMDGWYIKDPRRRDAWELWKREHPEMNRNELFAEVPLGIGEQYLARIPTRFEKWLTSCLIQLFVWAVLAGAALWGFAKCTAAVFNREDPKPSQSAPTSGPAQGR